MRPNGVIWVVRDQKLKELPVSVAYTDENEAIAYLDQAGPFTARGSH
ncbi:hypothetical protein [Bremerella cremea]